MRHTSRKTIVNAKQCTLPTQHSFKQEAKPTHCRRYRGVNATPRIGTIKQHVLAVALTIVCAICFSSISAAATNGPQQTRTYHLDLPEQTVATALNSLSEQTDIQVLFPYDIAAQLTSEPLLGRFSIELALERLLRDTGLHGGLTSSGVITISQTGSESTTNQNGKGKRMNIKNSTKRKTLLAGLVGLFAAGGMTQSVAQGGEAATSQSAIDEIIVTATRRAESLNDTALSIAAIGSEEISRRNLSEMNDYLRTIPGVNFIDQGVGRNAVVVRGLTIDPQTEVFQSSPTAGVYFGEVPLGGLSILGGSSDIRMIDIERVEVLRGPQGTLFGSGTLTGAVRNIPVAPNLQDIGGSLKAGYSNTGGFGSGNNKIEGIINIPLVEDKLAIRAVAYHHDTSGYIKNIAGTQLASNGPVASLYDAADAVATYGGAQLYQDQDDIGAATYTGGRVSMLWTPVDNLNVTLQYISQDVEQEGEPFVQLNTGGFTQVALQFGDNNSVLAASNEGLNDDVKITNLVAEYDLGWATLLSSSSWLDDEGDRNFDATSIVAGLPLMQFTGWSSESFVEELRLVSQLDGSFQYVLGVYYEDTEDAIVTPTYATGDLALRPGWAIDPSLDPTNPLADLGQRQRAVEQLAFYGELSYEFTNQFELTLGARHFDYERSDHIFGDGAFGFRDDLRETEEDGTNLKANLSYKPNEDALFYAQWAEGFRLGNAIVQLQEAFCDANNDGILDGTSAPIRDGFDSDTLENLELGGKLTMLDGRLQINGAVYRADWKDIPVLVAGGALPGEPRACFGSTVVNAGEARSQGFEVETIFQASDSLRVNLGGAYTNVELTEDVPTLGALDGDRLPSAPKYNVNFGLQYDFSLSSRPSYLRADYAYVGDFYNQVGENGGKSGDYGQLSMSGGITIDNVNVELFVHNLTDEDNTTHVGLENLTFDTRAWRIRPRTIGLSVGFTF